MRDKVKKEIYRSVHYCLYIRSDPKGLQTPKGLENLEARSAKEGRSNGVSCMHSQIYPP
jgi:hypothetical protein